jgi:hypothetical protein
MRGTPDRELSYYDFRKEITDPTSGFSILVEKDNITLIDAPNISTITFNQKEYYSVISINWKRTIGLNYPYPESK